MMGAPCFGGKEMPKQRWQTGSNPTRIKGAASARSFGERLRFSWWVDGLCVSPLIARVHLLKLAAWGGLQCLSVNDRHPIA